MAAVSCEHCGARYETSLPLRAIERIRRCAQCGRASLVAIAEAERELAEHEAEPEQLDRTR